MRYTHTDHPRLPPRHLGEMRDHIIPHSIASTDTVLSISSMRVPEAWRVEAVWDKEARDGGYGRSRPRKERLWTKTFPTAPPNPVRGSLSVAVGDAAAPTTP